MQVGTHNPWLVTLSVAIAIFSSWMALLSVDTTRANSSRHLRALGYLTASMALGCGVWAMHFIGMLAYHMDTKVGYDPLITAISVLPSLLAALVAVSLLGRGRLGWKRLLAGGTTIGIGIGVMHYTGMAALRMPYTLSYDPTLFAASLVLAVTLATIALWTRAGLADGGTFGGTQARRALSAVVLGAAIAAMHYTAMAAARFASHGPLPAGEPSDNVLLALLVSLVTVTLTAVVLVTNGYLRHREFFLELRDSEARLRALLATAVDGVITINAAGIVEAFNASAENIFQWQRAEVIGRPVTTLIGGDDAAGQDSFLDNYLRTGQPKIIGTGQELLGVRKDGSRVPIRLAIGHARVAGQDLFVAFVTDISERKAIELALRQSEQQFRSLIGNIPGIAYRCKATQDWPMLFISENVERLTGYPAADFLGASPRVLFSQLIHPDDRGYAEERVGAAIARSQPFLIEYRLRHKDGSLRWMWENGSPAPDEDGNNTWLDGVILDITERKAAEIDIQRFSAIVASSNDAIISKDLNGMITSWNRGAQKVFGYTAEEVVGRPMLILFPPDRQNEEREILERIATGEKVDHFETARRRKDGTLIDLSTTISPILDTNDHIVGASTISRDISERRAMEEALLEAKERAERAAMARAAFLANMSHEIRTPMNAILGFTDILLLGNLDSQQRRHLDTVRNSARSLLRLLNEILDTAKLDRGVMDLEIKDFDLLSLIDEISSTLGAAARQKGLSLHIRYSDSLPGLFQGDELRIRQVLTNLLGNAIKFTESGHVTLHVSRANSELHFMVQDTGIGIPPHRVAAIFEPFTQADASMSRRFGGTGLGTTISKKLVELMGGRISVESEPGLGTTFHVWLPLPPALGMLPTSARPQPPPMHELPALPPLRILVADDVPQNLELLGLLLTEHGHSVVCVPDGATALERASAEYFDVVLMDVQMPVMNGLQATTQLRSREAASGRQATPVIALTASVMDEDQRAASAAGMDGFASKPIDIDALMREMARVLSHAAAQREAQESAREPVVFDHGRALARWVGRSDVFDRSLRRFARDHADLYDALAGCVARDDLAHARSLAHRIRGQAANLGLELLAALLLKIEDAISDHNDRPSLVPLLDQLPTQLDAALRAIDAHLPTEAASTAAAAGPLDASHVQALAQALMRTFRRGQVDEATLAALSEAIAGHVNPAGLAALRRAVDDFDFSTAVLELQALLAQLAATDKDPA